MAEVMASIAAPLCVIIVSVVFLFVMRKLQDFYMEALRLVLSEEFERKTKVEAMVDRLKKSRSAPTVQKTMQDEDGMLL